MDLTRDQKIARQRSELGELREHQISVATGESDEQYVEANRNSKFKIRAIEAAGFVHVWTRVKHLSQDQKSFVNEDRIVPIHAREFDKRVKDGAFSTYDEVEVIHDPRKGAPKTYVLKPSQLSVEQAPSASTAPAKSQEKEIERQKQQVAKEAERLEKIQDLQTEREKEIARKEAELAAREKALAEAESKPEAATAAASAPAPDVKITVEPSATAASATASVTPDPKADKAKK